MTYLRFEVMDSFPSLKSGPPQPMLGNRNSGRGWKGHCLHLRQCLPNRRMRQHFSPNRGTPPLVVGEDQHIRLHPDQFFQRKTSIIRMPIVAARFQARRLP